MATTTYRRFPPWSLFFHPLHMRIHPLILSPCLLLLNSLCRLLSPFPFPCPSPSPWWPTDQTVRMRMRREKKRTTKTTKKKKKKGKVGHYHSHSCPCLFSCLSLSLQ